MSKRSSDALIPFDEWIEHLRQRHQRALAIIAVYDRDGSDLTLVLRRWIAIAHARTVRTERSGPDCGWPLKTPRREFRPVGLHSVRSGGSVSVDLRQ